MDQPTRQITDEQLANLIEAAMDLLDCARLMHSRLTGESDPSRIDDRRAMDEMAVCLDAIGLLQYTYEEFISRCAKPLPKPPEV